MTYQRLPYADAETLRAMSGDAHEAGANLPLPGQRHDDPTQDTVHSSFAASVEVPDSLAALAASMELHFD